MSDESWAQGYSDTQRDLVMSQWQKSATHLLSAMQSMDYEEAWRLVNILVHSQRVSDREARALATILAVERQKTERATGFARQWKQAAKQMYRRAEHYRKFAVEYFRLRGE